MEYKDLADWAQDNAYAEIHAYFYEFIANTHKALSANTQIRTAEIVKEAVTKLLTKFTYNEDGSVT